MKRMFNFYPNDTLVSLEFDKILRLLEDKCIGSLGKEQLKKNTFTTQLDELHFMLKQVAEMKNIFENGLKFPSQNYVNLHDELKALRIKNNIIEGKQFRKIKACAETIKDIDLFFKKHNEEFLSLRSYIQLIDIDNQIIDQIDQIIDEEGVVRTNASPELQKIRKEIIAKSRSIQSVFNNILSNLKGNNTLADTEESIRNGRRVLAIQAENKRRIGGIIHDESDSGKTSYIEPQETVLLNNQLFELERDEKREIHKILKTLSEKIAIKSHILRAYQEVLSLYDFVRAKALLAIDIDASLPLLNNNGEFSLQEAYHPLLYLKNSQLEKETVPFDVTLNKQQSILLISGPNAGGKSVSLKAIGLLQLMLQFGLLIPCDEHSSCCLFTQIITDLGDKQSIENELSTYSSRLMNMKYFIEHADKNTLFFIDEFGTGTDPRLGAAMAEAIMLQLAETKAFGVITTHYSNLKKVAAQDNRFLNAAMIFDENTLAPTYRLQTGKPGSSFTFAIAEKTGLSSTLIDEAKSLVDYSDLKFEELIQQVEQERKLLEKENKNIRKENKKLKQVVAKFEKLNQEITDRQKELRAQIHSFEKEKNKAVEENVNKVLNEINKAKSKKVAAEKAKELTQAKSRLLQKKEKAIPQIKKVKNNNFKVGDLVVLGESENEGEIIELRGNKAIVAFRGIKTTLSLQKLQKIIKEDKQQNKTKNYRNTSMSKIVEREFDIRGLMQQEARLQIEQYFDQALLNDVAYIKIIHGRGTGALRKTLQDIIKEYRSNVAEWHYEDEKKGGNGATIVRFK